MIKNSVLVIEDNRLLREGITAMIDKEIDLKVAASFSDCAKALQWIDGSAPDLILLDLGLRNQNSLNFVKGLKKIYPDIKIVIMDLAPVQEDVLVFVQAGVSGFIVKDATIEDFIITIRNVIKGEKVLPHNLTDSLFSQIISYAVTESDASRVIESVIMTKRERQVIELVADGSSNKDIAQKLHLSPYTIKSHVHNILEKLTLHSRVQIAKFANDTNNNKNGNN